MIWFGRLFSTRVHSRVAMWTYWYSRYTHTRCLRKGRFSVATNLHITRSKGKQKEHSVYSVTSLTSPFPDLLQVSEPEEEKNKSVHISVTTKPMTPRDFVMLLCNCNSLCCFGADNHLLYSNSIRCSSERNWICIQYETAHFPHHTIVLQNISTKDDNKIKVSFDNGARQQNLRS